MEKVKIELQDISKSYYSETTVTQALHKVSLTFYEREFVAITGESGSGKSTLLNIIGGMDFFDDGEMFVDGEPTFQYDEEDWEEYRRNRIGYVFQDYSLVGHYTALANVMSALLIMGYEQKQAEETAMKYLEQVGLKGYETHRASELSSGQKQRLSIARALAKNTGIIVADEPTGNLDSETGEQIIQLLKELSKSRLVIMVTHNYEQAAKYVTRKIRLHEGNVVSDVQTEEERDSQAEAAVEPPVLPVAARSKKEEYLWQNRVAAYFAKMNRRTQKGRAVLFTAFLLVVSVVSFLFIGELFLHADDTSTKEYSTKVYYKPDKKRLVAKRADGGELTEEDIEKMRKIANVTMVDSCEYANDIIYYVEEGRDYHYAYGEQEDDAGEEIRTPVFTEGNKFVLSVDCIGEKDLAAGRMPESRREVVLYAEDESVLNTDFMCYFQAKNIWGANEYCGNYLTVVGLLKEPTEQIYFTRELCQMLSLKMDYGEFRIYQMYDAPYGDYRVKEVFIPVIADDLSGKTARLSKHYGKPPGTPSAGPGPALYHHDIYDRNGESAGESEEFDMEVVMEKQQEISGKLLEVSEELFYLYCPKDRKSVQAAVYLTSYAKTDSVIRKLERKGYLAESTYRVGVTDYVENLVNERLIIIAISAFGLLAALLAEILILRSLMRIRVKDYFVLKFIGMRMPVIRKMSYFEVLAYCITAMILTVVAMWILRFAGVGILQEMMWYYSFGAYLIFAAYNLVASVLTVASFNHLLKGRLNA